MKTLSEMNENGDYVVQWFGNYAVVNNNGSNKHDVRYRAYNEKFSFVCSGMTLTNAGVVAKSLSETVPHSGELEFI